jgi:hypothetical protein
MNSHDEENTPVQHISGSLRTRASDNNVARRPEPAELQPTVADATKSTPSLTKLLNTTIISACLITMVTSWDHQGNFDKHTLRAKWAIQVILVQLGFLIYQYLIIRVLPQVEGDEDAEAFREKCVMSRSLKTAVGAISGWCGGPLCLRLISGGVRDAVDFLGGGWRCKGQMLCT